MRRIWRRAERWNDWRSAFDPDAAEIRGPAERLVKAAFRAVAGDFPARGRLDRVREILDRALRDLEGLLKRQPRFRSLSSKGTVIHRQDSDVAIVDEVENVSYQ